MIQSRWIAGGTGVVLVLCASAFLLRPSASERKEREAQQSVTSKTPQETKPVLEEMTKPTVESEGEIRLTGMATPSAKATISVRMPARIVFVGVQDGASVRVGQTLVQLDDQDFQGQERVALAGLQAALAQLNKAQEGYPAQRLKADTEIATAGAGLKQAQIKLSQAKQARDAAHDADVADRKQAEEGVRKAEIGLERAQKTRKSLEELAKVGGVSRSDLEGAVAAERVSLSDWEVAKAQLKRLQPAPNSTEAYRTELAQRDVDAAREGVRQAEEGLRLANEGKKRLLALAQTDLQAANAAIEQARAGLLGVREARASLRIVSPLEGVVSGLAARLGETAQPGMPLMTVVSLSNLKIEALVPTRQAGRLRVGGLAEVTLDSAPNRIYSVSLVSVASVAEADGRTFRVQFRFRNTVSLAPNQIVRIRIAK